MNHVVDVNSNENDSENDKDIGVVNIKDKEDAVNDEYKRIADLVEDKAANNPTFYSTIETTNDGKLKHLFWVDDWSRSNFQCFGDVLTFDTTYKKNEYDKPLVIFFPGPPNNFMVKKPTRLGKLIASALSFSSSERVAFAPSAHFPINRHAREVEGGFQGSEVEGIERTKKEEEEKRGNEVEALPNRNRNRPYVVSCSVFFVQLSISFVFKI
ncbi:hypothetical protein JHK87_000957 [Glycine soja]|nr:hypothetical protein JHK87_000957 [Glycine soja]